MIALTAQRQEAATETYKDVERLIDKAVWGFIRKFGGEFDELRADADAYYMKAYCSETFDSTRSSFSTYVWNSVWNGLIQEHARPKIRKNKPPVTGVDFDKKADREWSTWTVNEFAMGLSADALIVLELVLYTPDDLQDEVESRGGSTSSLRAGVKRYLKELGWAGERITESFGEIAQALGG